MIRKVKMEDAKLLDYSFIGDIYNREVSEGTLRSKHVHNALSMEAAFLYGNMERFLRHNGNK